MLRENVGKSPVTIWSSGGLNNNVMWLNVKNPNFPELKGTIKVAVNSFY